MIRNVILDWSGTLVDDLPAVLEATNHVLRQTGRPALSLEGFRAQVTMPVSDFYSRMLPGEDPARMERWFFERFQEVQDRVTPLAHAADFLCFCEAHGRRVFVFTAVPEPFFHDQLNRLGWARWVEAAWSGAVDKRTSIGTLMEQHGLRAEETLFVGDMAHDLDAARAGGAFGCAVLTGYQGLEALRAASPHLIVEHLGELRRRLEEHSFDLTALGTPRVGRMPVATVGALVFNSQGEVLLVRTHKWSNLWGIPGGKIQYQAETAEQALRREIQEETGLVLRRVEFALVQDCVESAEFYRPEHFVLLNYVGEVAGVVEVRLNDEAQEFRWAEPQAALGETLNQPTRVLIEWTRVGKGRKASGEPPAALSAERLP